MRLCAVYGAHVSLTTTSVLGVLGIGRAAKPGEEEEEVAKQLEGTQRELVWMLDASWRSCRASKPVIKVCFAETMNGCSQSKSHRAELATASLCSLWLFPKGS